MGASIGRAAARLLAELLDAPGWPGLTDAELDAAEDRFGFTFADDHRAFLRTGVPTGPGWPDWRAAEVPSVARPVEGVLFDVERNHFWYAGWGPRPSSGAVDRARSRLAEVPRLVPVHGHRYLPAGRGTSGLPVLSVMQTDVVVYGATLLDWVPREFAPSAPHPPLPPTPPVPFWTDL